MTIAAHTETKIGNSIDLKCASGVFKAYHLMTTIETCTGERKAEGVAISSLRQGAITRIFVRVQSSCLFSEAFGSIDCDCALQLTESIRRLANDEGLVVYFYEEGRGAGLELKMAAISLQQRLGVDSEEAYRRLQVDADLRSYEAAAAVIKSIGGAREVLLLSNNPIKEASLRGHGINVIKREQLLCGSQQSEIARYLDEKRRVFGHDIPTLEPGKL